MYRLLVCIFLSFLTFNCSRQNDVVKKLPELPEELAGNLELVRTAPVLMNQPLTAPSLETDTTALVAPLTSSCIIKYAAQVLYPVTICYPWNELIRDLDLSQSVSLDPDPDNGPGRALDPGFADLQAQMSTVDSTARFYKLSSFKGRNFVSPYLCSVKSGPWTAIIFEKFPCKILNPIEYILIIAGIPEPVTVTWKGSLEDTPAPVHLVGLTEIAEGCSCCPGYHQCPEPAGCIPDSVPCPGETPF